MTSVGQFIALSTAVLLLTGAVSCNDPMSHQAGEDVVIVSSGETDRLVVLSGPDGSVLAKPTPIPQYQDAHALTPDSQTLYFTAFDSIPNRALLTMSTRSFTITSRVLTELENRSQVAGLALLGNYGLALSPDGARLLLADAIRGPDAGIAVIDVATETPVAFVGPLSVSPDGLTSSQPTPAAPQGRVFVIGTRTPGVFPRADSLFIIDAETLEITHVASIAMPAADGSANLFAMQPAPSGERVYLLGTGRLYAYDVTAQQVIADAPAPQYGSIAVAPDEATVYVTDPGDGREFPGAGLVLAFSASLEPRLPIDLRSQTVDGVPPVTEGIAVSPNGRHLYVVSGTASRGPLFGPQPRQLFIVELPSGELVRTVTLGDYGAGPVFVR